MEENPYAPPSAELEHPLEQTEHYFYVVSPGKFTVLFFATLSMYAMYWFYANWRIYRAATGERLWPIPRAIFDIFFVHALFRRVNQRLEHINHPLDWSPNALAWSWIVIAIISGLADRLSWDEIGSPYSDVLSIAILLPLFLVLRRAQEVINICEGDPDGTRNANYTIWNAFWIALGIGMWLMVALGFLVIFDAVPDALIDAL